MMDEKEILQLARKMWFGIIRQPTSETTAEYYPAPHDEASIIAFANAIRNAALEEAAEVAEIEAANPLHCAAAIREAKG